MINYIVKPEEKMVIATLKGCSEDVVNIIDKQVMNTKYLDCLTDYNSSYSKYLIPNKFSSAVKCDPRDEFDIEDGKQKAKKRLLDKYFKSRDKAIFRYVSDMSEESYRVFNYLTGIIHSDILLTLVIKLLFHCMKEVNIE